MKTRIMSGLKRAALFAALSCGAGTFAAVTNVWTGASSGTWTDPANWDTHAVPAADDIAVFTGAATVAPPAEFRGCIRNMGAGELTVSVSADAEFSLALGSYSFADTGASFRKTGSGTLTLHAWPGINPGTVTVAEGAVNFAGNGGEAPGAFDRIVVEPGASATVVASPAATRHGYAYRMGKPSMVWQDGAAGDFGEFRDTGDITELVRRWEQWYFVREEFEGTPCRFSGIATVDDDDMAFDKCGFPKSAEDAVYAFGGSNGKNGLFYYRGIFICESDSQQTLTLKLTGGHTVFWRMAINGTSPYGANAGVPATRTFSRTLSRGWATLTSGMQVDMRFDNPYYLLFNLSDGSGALTGKRLWNGVCANALEVAQGATFTIGDGQAFAVANARSLKNAGTFASATDDAVLYLASDWDTGDAKLKESSISGFTGTLEYGTGAMDKTLVALSNGDTLDLPRAHLPSLDEKTSLQPVSDATWQRTGNTAYTNGNTAIAIFADWEKRNDSNGARAAIIAKEGIPVYCAFEMSCDFYMVQNPPYPDGRKDADIGLFVQSQGPSLTYYNAWSSRSAYMLPRYKQAFGASLGYYYKKLLWVTNTVSSVSNPNTESAKFIDYSAEDQSWMRPANGFMKWTLSYDGHGTFTASVQTNNNGKATTATYTYPQLTDAKYAETTFYPSILGRFKHDGGEIKPVIVSNIVLKVHARTAPAWPVEVASGAAVTVRGASVDAAGALPYGMDGAILNAGASVSVEPYGNTTGVEWTDLTVAGPSSIAAAQGVTNRIGNLVYTGSMQASTLSLTGPVAFASPLSITVPAAWASGGGGAVLANYSAATCVAVPVPSQISIVTDEGDNVTSKFRVSAADGRLVIASRGMLIIFR